MRYEVKLSVRSLVEYVFLSGSIETGFRTSAALQEGTRIHQHVQATYGKADEKEVYVHLEIPYEEIVFFIDGRCDGILFSDDGVTIDEIKSTSQELDVLIEAYPVHWAQAKFYAYAYAQEHGLSDVYVQITYVQKDTAEQKQFRQLVSLDELEAFVLHIIEQYASYALLRKQLTERRNESIQTVSFPFPAYRDGQRKLAGAVYKTIADGTNLFAQAPTGIGKTISTLFPAVKAIHEGFVQRIFYVTAKTITRTAAEEAFRQLEANGLRMSVVTLTAKDKICFQDTSLCQKEHCEFANGYYDRVNEAVMDILSQETIMDRKTMEAYARKHTVCPFEFSLDVMYAADAVICDYNYIFDPRVSLKRLLDEQKRHTVLLVDEAHNLVDRARDMFSAALHKSSFLQLHREFKGRDVGAAAKAVNEYCIQLRKQCGDERHRVQKEKPDELISLVEEFIAVAEQELASGMQSEILLDTYFAAQSFVRIGDVYDERHIAFVQCERSEVHVKLFCLDPSHLLQKMTKGYRSSIYFSATLMPMSYYEDMLGAKEDDFTIMLPSPFSKEQLRVRIQPLSTRYRDRERTREPIARTVYNLVQEQPGNYLVFFPSYQYMNDVYEQFAADCPDINTIVQQTGMAEEEREAFLASFQADNAETHVGFAVLGGIFSEGVDLKGDRLNGVVVVGVGLPQIGLERDIIKEYFNEYGKNGYDYAYVFPGMNKVLQAGGRLIRSEQDTGTIVLVDDRFLQSKYQWLLPDEWKGYDVIT